MQNVIWVPHFYGLMLIHYDKQYMP